MGVLHYGKDPLPVFSTAAESVKEVRQPVFVEGSSDKNPYDDGGKNCNEDIVRRNEIKRCGGNCGCQPSHKRPVFNNAGIGFLRGLVESPEGQSGKEYERGPDPFKNIW